MFIVIRWLVLLVVCLGITGVTWIFLGHQLSIWSWHVCPQGFWRESPGECVFPFVSILQLSFAYGLTSMLLLFAVALLAPVHKFSSCILLLIVLALLPAYILIFKKFSWVALVSLSSVIVIAVCFMLGAFVAYGIATGQNTK
ncbi:MAG: hypothetical protein PHR16_04555 [Methylovulum sp.]|nr:hypothetical protein [Methylovulum sp.]